MSSLKNNLRMEIIKNHPKMTSLDSLHLAARVLGNKESTAERKLRELVTEESIESVRNNKGFIGGYKWIKS